MRLPKKLTGTHPLVAWGNALLDWLQSDRLVSVVGGRLHQTTTGRTLTIDLGGGGASPPGGGMNYRGTWTPAPPAPYREFDVVIVQTGSSAGTYISVLDNNSNNPATGIGWVQIAPGDAFGRWQ